MYSKATKLERLQIVWESAEKYLRKIETRDCNENNYGPENCPCCVNFPEWDCRNDELKKCPISVEVSATGCANTPYDDLSFAFDTCLNTVDVNAFIITVTKEYAFLVSLAIELSDKYREEYDK